MNDLKVKEFNTLQEATQACPDCKCPSITKMVDRPFEKEWVQEKQVYIFNLTKTNWLIQCNNPFCQKIIFEYEYFYTPGEKTAHRLNQLKYEEESPAALRKVIT